MVWFSTVTELFDVEVDVFTMFVYLTSNWRQLVENIVDPTFNSSRTVENQTMVLFWLLIGLKFREFWYINLYVLKKKVFYLYRVWACDVMKSLQWNEAYTKKVYDRFWNFRTQFSVIIFGKLVWDTNSLIYVHSTKYCKFKNKRGDVY